MNEQEQKLNAPQKTRASSKPTKIPGPKVTPQNNLVPFALFPGFGGEAGKAFSFSRLTSKAREKRKGDEVAPKKSYAEFSRLKNFQRELKFGCTLFAELLGWDRRALPRIIWLVLKTLTYTKPPKKINAKLSYPKKFRSRKFQTPKNPGLRSFPSLEIRTTAPPGQVKFG